MTKPLCIHCNKRVGSKARGLCALCHQNHAIRNLYPRIVETQPKQENWTLWECPPPVYPSATQLTKCCHDKWEDECPTCEREQREELQQKKLLLEKQ